jgi:cellulose synthase/poly-beta-1,6-N-acetylglucosamine synthase-like glycosyltransferase
MYYCIPVSVMVYSADTLFTLFQILLCGMLLLPVIYIFVFAAAGLFYRQPDYPQPGDFRNIAVLIPGYREDEVIIHVAADALKQDYPGGHFDVVVIADSFQPETLTLLRTLPLVVVEVAFEKSTKAKALNRAMDVLADRYDLAVVLDADNLMAADFLSKVNAAFERDIMAVQGHRTAKNLDTPLAILDAVSEEINNHIFRKGHRVLGLSSAIIGSGMAFRYAYFKEMMASATAVGGFDKEIELRMLREGHHIAYLDDALVYDEKVQKAEVFSNQRRRWLSAQLHYFRKDIAPATRALFMRGNIDYFDKAIQFIQPPRILLLGAVIFSTGFFLLLNLFTGFAHTMNLPWLILLALCLLAFLFSVPRSFYNTGTLRALASLPKGMILMLGSLLKIKGANKQFIHTRHTAVKDSSPK